MARIWCEGAGEFRHFDAKEFREFGGVRVHAINSWHLTNGDVIEMERDGVPKLASGRPVVAVREVSAAEAEASEGAFGALDVAPDEARGD
jgi:hypothetical protein